MSKRLVYVRTKVGRIARESPRGEYIPSDRYVPVHMTAYIARLIEVHGDIEVEPKHARPSTSVKPMVEKKDKEE